MKFKYEKGETLEILKETLKYAVQCELCEKDKNGNDIDIDLCVFCNKACCDDCMSENGICVKCKV